MSKKSIIASLIVFSLFTFSCKNVSPIDTIKSLDAKTLEDSCQSCKEPSEDYLKSRTLRDELVEDIIFADYKIDEKQIDERLVQLVFGNDVEIDKKVYKKNKETLLSYTLPSVVSDDAYQNIVFDESKPDCITVWAFDFYIEGAQGFAIVSNDDRLGGVFYYSLDNINKAEVKVENIAKINEKISKIKQEWSKITSFDIYSVFDRAWGLSEGDVKTRGKNLNIKDVSSSDIVSLSASYTQVPFIFKDFVKESDLEKIARDAEFEYSNAIYWFLKEMVDYYTIHGSLDESMSNSVVKNIHDEYKKVLDNSNSVSAGYGRHGYHIINKNKHDLIVTLDLLIRNENPILSYTYYDVGGNKRTIPNVWKYIKNLKPGEPLSDLAKRILQHVVFYIEGGAFGYNKEGSVINTTEIGSGGYYHFKNMSDIKNFEKQIKEYYDFDFSKINIKENYVGTRGSISTRDNLTRIDTEIDINEEEYPYFSRVLNDNGYAIYELYTGSTFENGVDKSSYEYYYLVGFFRDVIRSGGMSYNKSREYIKNSYNAWFQVKKKKKTQVVYDSECDISFNAKRDWFVTSGGNFLDLSKNKFKNFLVIRGMGNWVRGIRTVSLPVSFDDKIFVDVIRNGRFELDTESNFKSYKKSNVEQSGDSNATVSEYITVVPDPESTKGLSEQWRKKNPGKKSFKL